MRILFGAWPAYGHLLPMVPVIRAAQRGATTSWCPPAATCRRQSVGWASRRIGPGSPWPSRTPARMPDHSTISELPPDEQPGFAARHLFGAGAVNRATCVLELLQTWLPDLVVYDTLELGSRPLPPCTGYRTSRTATVRWCRTPPTSPRRSGRRFPRRAMDLIHYGAR